MKKLIHTSRVAILVPSLGISLLLSGLFAPQSAQAATGTWAGTNGATWDINATNWTGVTGTPWDSSNGLTNTALFSTAANATVSGTVYANTITFGALTTLTGGTITLAGSSPTINGSGAGINIIYSVLAGTNGLVKSGAGTVALDPGAGFAANTFSGDITINGGNLVSVRSTSLGDGAGAITINSGGVLNVDWSTVTRTGLVTVNGGTLRTQGGSPQLINNGAGFVLQNGGAITTSMGGSGGLTVTGARSYLYSANTYTGGTVISNGGDLALLFGGALPTNTALELSGNFLVGNQNNTVGGLTGASTGRLIGATNYTFTVNKASGSDTYGGTIESVGTFIKAGAGTLSLTNANNNTSFPGALTVNNGVLELGGAGRFAAGSYSGAVSLSSASSVLQIATSANQTLSGGISGSGRLTKSSTGTLTLSGSNSYAGGTTVSGGTLTASHANALGDAAGAITVNGATPGSVVLNVNANMTRTGTVTLNGGDLGTGNGSTLTINGGGFVFTGSYASAGGVVLAGSSGLTNTASDGRLWAQATYTGDTVVNSGQLNIAGSGGIPTNSAVSIASGATVNLTSFFAPTNINRTIGGLTGAGVLYGAGGTVTVNKTSGSDTFSGDIQGGHGLIKAGAGTLVLAANNTYTGGTTISAGALQLGTGVGGTNGSVIGNITNNSTLIFSTAASTTNANIISGSGNVTKTGVTNSALTITNANTYSGGTTISAGEINLRNGSGLGTNGVTVADGAMLRIRAFDNSTVLIISNSMTVAGTGLAGIGAIRNQTGITTNQGKVTLSAAAMLNANTGSSLTFDVASGNAIEANNFNLTLSGAGVINVNDTIALGTGGLIKDAAGTANLNASNSYTGTTTLTAGTLALGHTDALKNSTLDTGTVNTRAVTFTVVGDNTYNLGGLSGDQAINIGNNTLSVGANNAHTTNTGILSGTGGLTKVGTGTLTLGNNQTYTGTTAVSGGTLNLSGGSLASTNYSVASTATLLISTSNEVLDTAAVTLSGGTIAKGSGAISETFGDLTLTQNSGVDFGAGTGNFTFATYTPGLFDLKFLNFNLGNSLTVNTGTFTASEFDFNGFGYSWDVVPSGGFTITAVPEPSTVLAALGLAGLMLWPAVRRLRRRIE